MNFQDLLKKLEEKLSRLQSTEAETGALDEIPETELKAVHGGVAVEGGAGERPLNMEMELLGGSRPRGQVI